MIHPNVNQETELEISPNCLDENLIDSYNYLIDKDYYFKDEFKEKNSSPVQKILQEELEKCKKIHDE